MAKKKKKNSHKKNSNKKTISIIILLLIIVAVYRSFDTISAVVRKPVVYFGTVKDIELPHIADSSAFLRNDAGRYSLLYSQNDKQAQWVAYMVSKADLRGTKVKRSEDFRPDPTVVKNGWKSATKEDYYKSSFDRGHLLPSADRNRDKSENSQTFLFSNISPQKAELNRNCWADLEQQIRVWAERYDTMYIVTGAVLNDKKLGYIGPNRVTVPHRYFKVIMSVKNGEYNAIGFVIPNNVKVGRNFMRYAVKVDKVESISKIDFFDNLPNKIEREIERKYNPLFWTK